MSRETQVPSIPEVRSDNVLEVLQAIKNTMQVREGQIGNPLDQAATLRDLVALGVASEDAAGSGTKSGSGSIPVNPTLTPGGSYNAVTDLTTPPPPVGLVASGGFTNVYLEWSGAPYQNHAYTEVWRGTVDSQSEAVLVGATIGNVYADPADASSTYYYWIRFVSKANVTGPFNSSSGTKAQTALDSRKILDALSGKITETELYAGLGKRIELIDSPSSEAGGVNYRLNRESIARAAAIQAEASARAQAILNEAASRASADSNLQTQINTLTAASTGDLSSVLAALQTEQTARASGDAAEAASRETLAAQIRGTYSGTDVAQLTTGLVYNERVARASADGALSSQISALSSTVTTNYNTLNAAITTEASTRATNDTAISSSLTSLSSQVNDSVTGLPATRSSLLTNYYTKAATDSAISTASTTLTSAYGAADATTLSSAQGYVQSYAYTKAETNSAISTQVDTVSSRLNVGGDIYSSIQTEATTRANADNSLFAQYTVKIDTGGYVSGFGLASTSTGATPSSLFAIRADAFVIGPSTPPAYISTTTYVLNDRVSYTSGGYKIYRCKATTTGRAPTDTAYWEEITSQLPFIVTTTPTVIDGVTYPVGAYIRSAYIADATITSAKIQSLVADKISTGSLTAAIGVTTGYLSGGLNLAYSPGDSSAGTGFFLGNNSGVYKFFVGSPNNNVLWDGTNLQVRGTIYASAGTVGGISMTASSLYSGQVALNSGQGFFLSSTGTFSVGNGGSRKLSWDGSDLEISSAGLTVSGGNATFSGELKAAKGSFSGVLDAAKGTFGGVLEAGVLDASQLSGQTFTYPNSGSYTAYTTTATISTVRFTLVGAGGGGAGGGKQYTGGGGSPGSVVNMTVYNILPGKTISVVVGAGGAGGGPVSNANSPQSGGSGGNTQITIGSDTYVANGGSAGTPLSMSTSYDQTYTNGVSMVYRTNDYGDFAAVQSIPGLAANVDGSIGGDRGGSYFGSNVTYRAASGTPSLLNGGSGTRGGGGGGGAPSAAYVRNRGFYIDPADGDGGDGSPTTAGGSGGNGYAKIEVFNPNSVVLKSDYDTFQETLNQRLTYLDNFGSISNPIRYVGGGFGWDNYLNGRGSYVSGGSVKVSNLSTTKLLRVRAKFIVTPTTDDSFAFRVTVNGSVVQSSSFYTGYSTSQYTFTVGTFDVAAGQTVTAIPSCSVISGGGEDSLTVNSVIFEAVGFF